MDWFIYAIGIHFVLSLTVSICILKADEMETAQKVAQIIVAWLIPYIAAIGIYIFLKSQDQGVKPKKQHGNDGKFFSDASGGD